jgi:flagellar export protein FliJ
MPEPRFSLLADLAQREQDDARRRLGGLERERVRLIARSEALGAERVAAARSVPPALRHEFALFWARIEADLRAIAATLGDLERAIAAARDALAEAHRRHATFAKLRERDQAEQRRQRERREARACDEFAARRFAAIAIGDRS